MPSRFSSSLLLAALTAGCSVDYEVDPNFGAIPALDSTTDATDEASVEDSSVVDSSMVDSSMVEDTGALDTNAADATDANDATDGPIEETADADGPDTAIVDTAIADTGPAAGDAGCTANPDCLPGYACCGGVCKSLNEDPTNCGSCGSTCPTTLGTPKCTAGKCGYATCPAGLGDCDGSGMCATTLTDNISHCGACGNACTVANGTPACTGTTCTVGACGAGFGDCNTTYADGCEQSLNTNTHCGGCGVACTRANATADCSTGTCALGACDPGFGNCDSNAANGCERALTTDVNHCGACGKACTTTNGTPGCAAGACTATCSAGYSDCDGNPASCEINHNSNFNSCATAVRLLDSGGSNDICATTTTESTVAAGNNREGYYRVRLVQCTGCSAGNPMRVRFTLVNPPGSAYDLRVWEAADCGGGPDRSSSSGTLGGTETVTFNNFTGCGTTSREFRVEVRYRAGRSCANYALTATGAY